MISNEKFWTIKSTNSIELHWFATPNFIKTEILWRGERILIEIKDEYNSKGSTTTHTINHKNETTIFGMAKWMGSGGGFGERPTIRNERYFLDIIGRLKSLELSDKSLEKENSNIGFDESAFKILF